MKTESAVAASFAFATAILLSAAALALGAAEQRSACIGDAFRFCGADIPLVTKIEACPGQNRNSLTPACAAEFQPAGRTALRPEHFRRD
jgi:hypothetical protein